MTQEVNSNDERYKIEARIGSGAMATVYRAYDQRLNRIVALKILHDHLATNNELRLRFEQEARLAARIDHPNVVRIYDFGLNNKDQIFMVSEFVDGRSLTLSLRRYMSQSNPYLSPVLAALVAHEIARGIEAAHRHSVIHRDLKPDNVLVSNQGEVKLTDFGVARPFDSAMTQVGQFIGSLTYASPEQIQGDKVDARSDIFSFGVILFELLTGQLPFRSTNPTDLAIKITQAKVPPLNQVRPSVPFELDSIVRKCLRADPAERPGSADLLVRDLALYLGKNEIQISPRMIQDGFENPNLFSSTIRRSPLSPTVQPENSEGLAADSLPVDNSPVVKRSTQVQEADLTKVAEAEPRLDSGKTKSSENVAVTAQTPGISAVAPPPVVAKQPQKQLQRVATQAKPTSKQKSPWASVLTLTLVIAIATVAIKQSSALQTWLEQLRHEFIQTMKNNTDEPSRERIAQSESTALPTEPVGLQTAPTAAPSQTPLSSTTPKDAEHAPSTLRTQQPARRPQQEPQTVRKSPPTTPPNQTPGKKNAPPASGKTKGTQPVAKPNREAAKGKNISNAAPKVAALNTGKPNIDSSVSSTGGSKSQLQIQTNPGPRTVELFRGNRKEFLGLSGRTNLPRTFSSLEPGIVLIQIPVEEVDGRKYEGFRARIKLEPGKQLNLPIVNSRALVNISLRCPPEIQIMKINGKKVLHRGGPLTVEAPLGGTIEVESGTRSGLRETLKFEIRNDGQLLNCLNSNGKER